MRFSLKIEALQHLLILPVSLPVSLLQAAWDRRVKNDSFAAKVNQTILRAARRDGGTGVASAENAGKDAAGQQVSRQVIKMGSSYQPEWESRNIRG